MGGTTVHEGFRGASIVFFVLMTDKVQAVLRLCLRLLLVPTARVVLHVDKRYSHIPEEMATMMRDKMRTNDWQRVNIIATHSFRNGSPSMLLAILDNLGALLSE